MTRKEALQSIIQFSVDDNVIEKVLIDQEVDGATDYTVADQQEIDLCLADLCLVLINTPDVTEGGFTIKVDKAALTLTRNKILVKYGFKTDPEW